MPTNQQNITPPVSPEVQKLLAKDEHALIIGSLGAGRQARRVLLPPTASKRG